jgi:hypothetical protein
VDLDCNLDLFASLITTTNYNKYSIVIPAWIILKAHLTFTLRELIFLTTSQLPWPMPNVLALIDSSSIFELSLSWNSLNESHRNRNFGSLQLQNISNYGRTTKEIPVSKTSVL